jgi:hypothetical protein
MLGLSQHRLGRRLRRAGRRRLRCEWTGDRELEPGCGREACRLGDARLPLERAICRHRMASARRTPRRWAELSAVDRHAVAKCAAILERLADAGRLGCADERDADAG